MQALSPTYVAPSMRRGTTAARSVEQELKMNPTALTHSTKIARKGARFTIESRMGNRSSGLPSPIKNPEPAVCSTKSGVSGKSAFADGTNYLAKHLNR